MSLLTNIFREIRMLSTNVIILIHKEYNLSIIMSFNYHISANTRIFFFFLGGVSSENFYHVGFMRQDTLAIQNRSTSDSII